MLDPLHGDGYQFWSGIGSNIAIVGGLYALWKQSRCHELGCRKRAWHTHPQHGHPVCRFHHPQGRGELDEQQ